MEFILHYMYVVAIKDAKAWQGATPAQLGLIGFWNLIIVWLKVRRVSAEPNLTRTAFDPMATIPLVRSRGWSKPTREHGQMHGQ